jgi:single-strand DNA-binding protein
MAGSLNKVMIIGNVGRDPEMRYLPNGTPVTNFTVAVNRRYNTPDGEKKEETEWFRVVLWRQLAEIANQYVTKGQSIYIEGRLQTRTWEGQDGQKRTTTEIVASQMQLLGSRPRTGGAPGEDSVAGDQEVEPDDIPFN